MKIASRAALDAGTLMVELWQDVASTVRGPSVRLML
jgi:hypothetical protein